MNKTELIEALAAVTDFTKADARRVIDALFDTEHGVIASSLEGGEKVQITGFGTFEPRRRRARMGRNPQTGERIRIPASTAISFRAGKGLKVAVQEGNGPTGPPPPAARDS